jgi:stage II sporulation protein R
MTNFTALCDDLRQNVLRLHIVANSDSAEDQNLKLKIRDEILKETGNLFLGTKDLTEAEKTAEESLKLFEDIANRVIKEEGFDYKATVSLGDQFFETRHYETFSLPAGTYRSLIVKLGKAEGKNWWCVIFPSICVPTSSSDLRQSVSENSAKIAEHSEKYIVRFKIIEIYEKLKRALS